METGEKVIGPCPACKADALVRERKQGTIVVNCWVCGFVQPDEEPKPREKLTDLYDDPDFYTTFPG